MNQKTYVACNFNNLFRIERLVMHTLNVLILWKRSEIELESLLITRLCTGMKYDVLVQVVYGI